MAGVSKVVETSIHTLGRSDCSEPARDAAYAALWRLSADQKNHPHMGGHESIVVLLHVMAQNVRDAEVQARTCSILCNLAVQQSYRDSMASADAVSVIVKAMQTHGLNSDVQISGCSVLANLAFDAKIRDSIVLSGSVCAIIGNGNPVGVSDGVHEARCMALRHLVRTPEQKKLGEQKCIQYLVALLNINSVNMEMKNVACSALLALVQQGKGDGTDSLVAADDILKIIVNTSPRNGQFFVTLFRVLFRVLRDLAVNFPYVQEVFSRDVIGHMVAKMTDHLDDANVQETACEVFWRWSVQTQKYQTSIGQVGGIPAIFAALKRHRKVVKIQQNACAALSALAHRHYENHGLIMQQGGLVAISCNMLMHCDDEKMQIYGCCAMWKLAHMITAERRGVCMVGIIRSVTKAMVMHSDSGEVQYMACGSLSTLAENVQNHAHMADLGAVDLVVSAMRSTSRHKLTLFYGCKILNRLTSPKRGGDFLMIQRIVCASQGLDAVIHAMDTCIDDANLQIRACCVLANAMRTEPAGKLIMESRGIPAILRSMNKHMDRSDVQFSALNALFMLTCCYTKSNGKRDPSKFSEAYNWSQNACGPTTTYSDIDAINEVVKSGGIEAVVAVMRSYPMIDDMNNCAVVILISLTNSGAHIPAVVRLGGLDAIINAMAAHKSHKVMQRDGCTALCRMLMREVPLSSQSRMNALQNVTSAMQMFKDDKFLQAQAIGSVNNLLCGGSDDDVQNVHRWIKDKGVIALVVLAMKSYHADYIVQAHGCLALCSISNYIVNGRVVAEAGGIHAISRAFIKFPALKDSMQGGCENSFFGCIEMNSAMLKKSVDFSTIRRVLKDLVKDKRLQALAERALARLD
jgi:hypothetical protein